MPRVASLRSMREQVRQRADMEFSDFVSDPEINGYINQSYAELWEFLVQSGQDWALTSSTVTTSLNKDVYDIPADFYKIRGADVDVGDVVPISMVPFVFEERNTYPNDGTWGNGAPVRYRLWGSQIAFIPKPQGAYTVTLWYQSAAPRLYGDDDEIDGINGFEEYVVLGGAIKCLLKEESDVSALVQMQTMQRDRILGAVGTRDAGHPERVTDVSAANWGRWGGDGGFIR